MHSEEIIANSAQRSPWSKTKDEVLEDLHVNFNVGLSSQEAVNRLKAFGKNELKKEIKISPFQRLLSQIESPVVIMLLIAIVVTSFLGDVVDSIAIGSIVIVNAIIGFLQETKAEESVLALKKLSAPKARVLRDGNILEVMGVDVCPGDILILEAGDYVPADCRIILANQLFADEAILTGESLPVEKVASTILGSSALADRKNMLFASTAVTAGSARAIVTDTGMNTEIGRIAGLLEARTAFKTPLQSKLELVSNKLLIFCGIIVVLVAILGLFHGETFVDVLMSAISLGVAAIPEGLPTVVTLALTMAVSRMSKRNAIVRHLHAVETLGSTDIICADKTGTLTSGKMRVRESFILSHGVFSESDIKKSRSDDLRQLIESSVLCSNASINDDGISTGDPTEVALIYLALDYGLNLKTVNLKYPRLAEWSHDSERKRMSVAVSSDSKVVIHCKGAPESILPLCDLSDDEKHIIQNVVDNLSSKGRRILAVATKNLSKSKSNFNVTLYKDHSTVEKNLFFLGLVSLADPPRSETIPAILECKKAGIKVVMITGDHPVTAKAIATELGIIEVGKFDQVITGAQLDEMSLKDLEGIVDKVAVYARVSPLHKLKVIEAWQKKGSIVAMTGDGVNDAPALKQASIGIAMGKGGTEVARQASSMILTDDNFATIVSAVEEGRAIYGNIRRTIQYLLSGNLSEILIMLGAALIGWPIPLAPIHLLWINLVTDGLPALALAAEPVPKGVLALSRRPSPATFFERSFYHEMIFVGVITSVLTLAVYGYSIRHEDELTARTYAFSFLVFAELFRSFSSRSEHRTFFQLGPGSNIYHIVAVTIPILFQIALLHTVFFQSIFKVKAINLVDGIMMFSLALIPVVAIEARKWLKQLSRVQKS